MTLKAYKAAIKVGTTLRVLEHWWIEPGTLRTVTKVQGNGYYYAEPGVFNPDGHPKRFWAEHPKVSQLEFDGKTARIALDEKRRWVIEITGEGT